MAQNELYHFGIKRRSGRYPWGSGERPYQREIKREINEGAKKAKSGGRMSKHKDGGFWNSHEIAYKMGYNLTNKEGSESIRKLKILSDSLNTKVEELPRTFREEFNNFSKKPGFKKDVYDQMNKDSKGSTIDPKDFYRKLESAVWATALSRKYAPETARNMEKLDYDIDDYKHTLSKEVDRLIGEIGSQKISRVNGGTTYGDVISRILEHQTMGDWKNSILERYSEDIGPLIYDAYRNSSYSLEEYNRIYRR